MRLLLSKLKRWTELSVLTLLLMVSVGSSEAVAGWYTSPGDGSGGFTGRPRITVELYVNDDQISTTIPVNLAGLGPNPSLPYTRTLTAVVRQDGRLFPTNIQLDLAPNLAQGALFKPDDLTQGFRSLPLENTSGIATAFFHASSTPGDAVITASARDPSTGQSVSASVKITVVDEKRPAAAITFTGAYVNAVIAGQSRFGSTDTPIQDGSYSRVISVVVNDANGNPTNPNTQINFYLVDGPITGYPSTPGAFRIAGSNGDPVDSQFQFNAVGGDFIVKGVTPFQRLVLGQPVPDVRIIGNVASATSLVVQSTSRSPFPAKTSSVPYIIGSAQNAAVLSPSFTDLAGVASTVLTYPVERIGQTAVLVACTADMSVCGTLNTCDVNGAKCKSVYLGVTNGSDRTLTLSATSLGPNRSTDVQLCLRDVNFTPLPATEIRYDIGSTGPAKVTVNGVEGTPGKILTGENGCTVAQIASSGQIPGGLPIDLEFTADFVAPPPAKVTIKSPGAGKMDGFFTCDFKPDEGTGKCDGTLRLTDDEGSPMAGVLIAVGSVTAPGEFVLTFNPLEGVFGKTDDSGQLRVSVEMKSPGAYAFPFQTAAGGTATFVLNATVPAPGVLAVALNGPTEAQLGLPYSAVLQATGGVPPYEWTLTSGSLPPGVNLGGDGSISGTPTQEGTFSFAVQAKDKNSLTGFGAFTITVGKQPALALTLDPTDGPVNVPYHGVVSASDGTEPYSFALLAGSLPPGLTLNSNGTLAGTPTAVGTFAFSVKASDSKGATGTANFSLTIVSASPLTVALEGGSGKVGADFSGVVKAEGGTTPYTFKIMAGGLPTGLTLNPNGTISGKPTAPGVFVATVEATDKNGLKGTGTITITIDSVDPPTIGTGSPLPDATLNVAYSVVFEATNGVQPYRWSLEAPSTLPPGFVSSSLNATTGALAGTPTTPGTYSFLIKVTDANGAFAIKSFTLKVGINAVDVPTIETEPQLPDAALKNFYTVIFTATGGAQPYKWSVEAPSTLPPGFTSSSLNATTGALTGIPTTPGNYNFIIRVTDAVGAVAIKSFALKVGDGGTGPTATTLLLLTSSPELPSSDQTPVTLTAVARDANNVLIKDAVISFQVKTGNGTLQVINATTDETGKATAELSAGGDKRNRDIVVGATSGAVAADDLTIKVTGTRLSVSGVPAAIQVGDQVPLTFTLVDSSDRGINGANLKIELTTGSTTTPTNVVTNSTGVAQFTFDVVNSGAYKVAATWDGNLSNATPQTPLDGDSSFTLSASPDKFAIEIYNLATNEIIQQAALDTPVGIRVTWTKDNQPVAGASVRVQTTKGSMNPSEAGSSGTIYVGVTDANGQISDLLTIQSSVPGSAMLSANGSLGAQTVAATGNLSFIATVPARIVDLQANPTNIGINIAPSDTERSAITAIVLDANDNPVTGQEVVFTVLRDTSGGALSASSAITKPSGQATVEYIAGSSPTQESGVRIQAAVPGTGLTREVTLTVAKKEIFITLGTGNVLREEDDPTGTLYFLPYNVLVNDIVGGPVAGANVILDIVPNTYYKGFYRNTKVAPQYLWVPVITATCLNEDANNNGILDPGEDVNNNGRLDPGNVATTSAPSVETDASGYGKFDVVYAQQYGSWTNVNLSASTRVSGTEARQQAIFQLAISAADAQSASPPGGIAGAFGVLPDCAISVDAETDLRLEADTPELRLNMATNPPATGNVIVTLTPTYTGATVIANVDVSDTRFSIKASPERATTNEAGQATFTVSAVILPLSVVPAGSYPIGSVAFSAGNSNDVVPVILEVQ